MRNLIVGNTVVAEDAWQLLPADHAGDIPAGPVIVPLALWLANENLHQRPDTGVWLDSHEEPESLAGHTAHLPMIAVRFPAFTDGRGYSIARLLRERLGYTGELRAFGDVLRDQLFFMKRCGFNSYAVREDRPAESALPGLSDFSVTYQAASDNPLPLFRR